MKIIVIEDEKHIRRIICDYLKNEKFEVVEAENGSTGLEQVIKHKDADLVLLDIRMPKMNGYEAIKEIKAINDLPVIFLTALDENYDEIKGLNLGADDYITKPFSYEVLMARIKSCLRKNRRYNTDIINFGDLSFDFTNKKVLVNGEVVEFANREMDVMEYLVEYKCKTLNRSQLLDRVWGYDYYGDPRTIDTHIKTIRQKLGEYGRLIVTVRGVGYRFEYNEKESNEI